MRSITRRQLLGLIAISVGTVAMRVPVATAASGAYPSRPIKLIAPFAAGGGTDTLARRIIPFLGDGIGERMVVENKPGANSILATMSAVQSAPDGYTLLLQTNSLIVNEFIQKDLAYSRERDLVPISLVARTPHVLIVSNNTPVKNVQELIAYAKRQPQGLSYGSAGIGSTNHLAAELFAKLTGVKMVHIAYKGSSEYIRDLQPGIIQLVFAGADQASVLVKSGSVRALATTGATRISALPDVPTMKEAGVPLEMYSWTGFFAPAKTPPEIVQKLSRALQTACHDQHVRQLLPTYELVGSSPEEFSSFLARERTQVAGVVQGIGSEAIRQ